MSSRTVAVALIMAGVVSLGQIAAPAVVSASQSDLSFTSVSTWTADPGAGRVHVVAVVTATSHTVDQAGRRLYYDQIQLTLPPFANGCVATGPDGEKLPITFQSVTSSSVILLVGLPNRLYSGESGTFTLKFDLVDSGGSTDRDFRISNNVVSFPVWAFGSPGTPGSSVAVLVPHEFRVQEEFGGLTRSVSASGEVVFTSGLIDDSTEMSAWFTAVQPVPASDFRVRNLTIGSLNLSLRYWVDDVGWADQVESVLRAGYPVLRDMIGLGDPIGNKLTVEEASSQEIGGFSGSYDPTASAVLVSYFADPFVILHEAAHMWFNVNLLFDRWAQEGFASYYAQQAVDRLGYADHAPVLTIRIRQSAVPLNDWIAAGDPNSAVDAYLYGASLEVARQVADQVGQPALTAVWLAARSGSAAYRPLHGNSVAAPVSEPTDWRRLLDLLEQTSGRSCTEIWRAWIVDPSQAAMLDQRDTARTAYGAADHQAGTWNLPPEIRHSLDGWQFGQAIAFLAQARAILTQRDQIAAEALVEKTTPPPGLQVAFERSGLAAANLEAANELVVLTALSSARQAQTESNGAAPAVGLLGADPAAELRSAREAFAKGDLSQAESLADGARSAWQSASGAGEVRIFGSLSVLAGGLLLLITFLWAKGVWAKGGGRRSALAKAGAAAGPGDVATTAPVDGFTIDSSGTLDGAGLGVMAMSQDRPATGDDGSMTSEESAYELLQRGYALLRDHHNAQAAVVLERAAKLERSKGSILEALARAYFNCGQPARAAETFEALLEVDPSAPYGHFGLGLSLARLGRPLEARTQLRMAVALDPASDTYKRALDTLDSQQG